MAGISKGHIQICHTCGEQTEWKGYVGYVPQMNSWKMCVECTRCGTSVPVPKLSEYRFKGHWTVPL